MGVYTYADGSTYDGAWREGKRDGQGLYTCKDGSAYAGAWKDDKKNGQGVNTYADGTKYAGAWEKGKRHGQGVFTHKNGSTYDGAWKNDKRDGEAPTQKRVMVRFDVDADPRQTQSGFIGVSQSNLKNKARRQKSHHRYLRYKGGRCQGVR